MGRLFKFILFFGQGLSLFILLESCSQPTKIAPISAPPSPKPSIVAVATPSLSDRKQAANLRQEGLRLRQQGQFEAAIAKLDPATTLDPKNPSGWVLLGWTQHLAGKSQNAVISLQSALKQDSQNVPALNALGIVYLVAGDLSSAVTTHQQALSLQKDNEIAHYNLSLAYERLKQSDLAIRHAQAAIKLEPSNSHPLVALAIAFWSQGNKPEAKKAFRQALNIDSRLRDQAFLARNLKAAGLSGGQIGTATVILKEI